MKMKSVCPMVCQKNENHLQKPSPTTADKSPVQNPAPIPLRPLRGLHSLHLNKSKRGEYNRGFALQTYLLNIQSKVFLVTLLSTPKEICSVIQQTLAENLPIPFPLEGDCGGEYKSLPLSSSPLRGSGGEHNQKLSLQRKVTYSLPLHVCTLRIRPSQSKQVPVQNN